MTERAPPQQAARRREPRPGACPRPSPPALDEIRKFIP
jgi:hypothetical protein